MDVWIGLVTVDIVMSDFFVGYRDLYSIRGDRVRIVLYTGIQLCLSSV
jgi:hypothetical protein